MYGRLHCLVIESSWVNRKYYRQTITREVNDLWVQINLKTIDMSIYLLLGFFICEVTLLRKFRGSLERSPRNPMWFHTEHGLARAAFNEDQRVTIIPGRQMSWCLRWAASFNFSRRYVMKNNFNCKNFFSDHFITWRKIIKNKKKS